MSKSEIRCTTPSCVDTIAKYGEIYHSVTVGAFFQAPPFMPDAVALCERCGGYTNGTEWKHVCKMCGEDVEPGKLKGFFVPHRCSECDEKVVASEKAKGHVCGRCNKTYAYCCC